VARIISGFIAHAAGWRVVFLCAAALMLGLSALPLRAMPITPPKSAQSYRRCCARCRGLVRREPVLRLAMVYGVICMAPHHLLDRADLPAPQRAAVPVSTAVIDCSAWLAWSARWRRRVPGGCTTGAGRRGPPVVLVLAVGAWRSAGSAGSPWSGCSIGIVVLDVATQARILKPGADIRHLREARSRINTAYVTATSSAARPARSPASALWAFGGWDSRERAGAVLSLIASRYGC